MEEIANNLTQKEVLEIIKDFPLVPLRNRLIITVNVEESDDELDLVGAGLDESQFVIARGSHVFEEIKPGTKVQLDLDKMSIQMGPENYQIKIDPVKVNGKVYAYIYDTSIKAIDYR